MFCVAAGRGFLLSLGVPPVPPSSIPLPALVFQHSSSCIPHPAFQFIGDFRDSIPRAIEQLGRSAALAHLDIGTGQKNTSLALASKIAPCIEKLLRVNAIVVSDQEVERWRSYKLQLPGGISENRIHLYRL